MQTVFKGLNYEIGTQSIVTNMPKLIAENPFSARRIEFLDYVSKLLLSNKEAKEFPDVITFAFWCRKSSIVQKKKMMTEFSQSIRLGLGTIFHIAPSNIAVNYAYSFVASFITGNASIVRIPSKNFPQVIIINRAIINALEKYKEFIPYICFVRYERNQEINTYLSSLVDVRVIWGGDKTIEEIRKSPLNPRSSEITFADRYSICYIDSDYFLETRKQNKYIENFYNDTYLYDQNACTSPRLVLWSGMQIEKARAIFWQELNLLVTKLYSFQSIMSVNKLTTLCLASTKLEGLKLITDGNNLITRIEVNALVPELMDFKENSGFFYEYSLNDLKEIKNIVDKKCQTLSYICSKEQLNLIPYSSLIGIDRIVPVGKTMDFDLIWDGMNLIERMTRLISIE